MTQITYQQLFSMYREEKGSNALSTLPENFDEDLREFIGGLKAKSATDPSALKELENSKKLAIALIGLRRQKIVLRAISSEEAKLMGANQREQDFYEQMKKLTTKEDAWLKETINTKPQRTQTQNTQNKKVVILKEIPKYTASNGEEYGPYVVGEKAVLPASEAEWMIEKKMAEKTNGKTKMKK